MNKTIVNRIRELTEQRQSWVERLQQLAQETEQARQTIIAFDGAIGELSRLVEELARMEDDDDAE